MANPTMTLIASNTVGSGGASSIDFTSIPSTYTDLIIKVSARTTRSLFYDNLTMTFNNISSGYQTLRLTDNQSSGTSSDNLTGLSYFYVGEIDGGNATSNTFSNIEIYVPNYTSNNLKSVSDDNVMENNSSQVYIGLHAHLWNYSGNPAINRITFASDSGSSFVQYSTFTLYGISNS